MPQELQYNSEYRSPFFFTFANYVIYEIGTKNWCSPTSAADNFNLNILKEGDTVVNHVTNEEPNLNVNVHQEGDTFIKREKTLPGTTSYNYQRKPDK